MKVSNCEYCGEDLGYTTERSHGDEPVVCGSAECSRWARDEMRAQQEEARAAAEEDGYARYGGGW